MADKPTHSPPPYSPPSPRSGERLAGMAYPAPPPHMPPPPYTTVESGAPAYRPSVLTPPPYSPRADIAPRSVPIAPPPSNWCENNMRNKPQSNSTGSISMLFIVAGMNMSWSAFNPTATNGVDWFIGAMIGAWVGAAINTSIKRKYLIMFASVITSIDGILYMTVSESTGTVTAARYCDGLALGIAFVPSMVLIGEESVPYMRGMLASSVEMMCVYIGISIQVTMNQTWDAAFSFNLIQMQGVMNVIFGLSAMLVSGCMYIESPVHHLMCDDEEKALDSLRRLQSPFMITTETQQQLRDLKLYVAENEQLTPRQNVRQALPPLFMLVTYRVWLALTFSAISCGAMVRATTTANYGQPWEPMVILFGNIGFISALIVCFTMDSVGRVKPTLLGAAVCGVLALVIGLLWDNVFHMGLETRMLIITYLLLIYQFFTTVSTPASTVYLTEAFPLAIKSYFISFPFIAQMLVQLIINSNYMGASMAAYFYCCGVFGLGIVMLAHWGMPETRKLPLLDAQILFKNMFRRRRQ